MKFQRFTTVFMAVVLLSAGFNAWAGPGAGPAEVAGLAALKPVPAVLSCETLTSVDVSKEVGAPTRLTSARLEGDMCAVTGNIDPSIGFQMRLPMRKWSQRYLQLGCGGLCGLMRLDIEHANGCVPAENGELVTATTNMGHEGASMGDGSFGRTPQLRIDFAYRAVHLTSVAAKAIIRRFYGQPQTYAYFSGCSDGGREALMEAQRFPDDFDGIAAGAPAMNFQLQNSFYHAWQARSNMDAKGKAIITADTLPILHEAALAECDALDGLKDSQIDDPRRCNFDPAVVQCKEGPADASRCLSAAQVEAARKIYAGPTDDKGRHFLVGTVQVGSELNWKGVFVPERGDGPIPSAEMAMSAVRNLVFETNPPSTMQVTDFKFDEATFNKLVPLHGLYDATNPDIAAFVQHGGKLMLWHGWADPHISPLNTIAYYDAVKKQLGSAADNAVRLFLFPGMGHCFGGQGPNQFDLLTPLMQWVESHHAPEMIVAGRPRVEPLMMGPAPAAAPGPGGSPEDRSTMPKGTMPPTMGGASGLKPALPVNRTRPIFAYPQVARYAGKGDVDQAANFVAATPSDSDPSIPTWLAASFYQPGFQKQCAVSADGLVCK
ncbi:tannase/feruloyl esterase family alpha/beta hydrolase [Dyella sp. C9]|uniref:tannase/feruloyl esterase family alpha/beta hydrolase n=1 Tax=Dyella sp. C9 TaxID=2202154 RepID=UPI000DEF20A0|nr:tannase/feruloyl esterase family alpha/beta hydrolase [Dyella sp. C9]